MDPHDDLPEEEAQAAAERLDETAAGKDLTRKIRKQAREAIDNASKQKDKTVVILLVVVGVVIAAVVAVVMLSKKARAPSRTPYTPQIELNMSSQEGLRSFTRKTAKEVTELTRTVTELKEVVAALAERQASTEDLVRDTMSRAAENFQQHMDEQLRRVDELAQSQAAVVDRSPAAQRMDRILGDFKQALVDRDMTAAEARQRAVVLLQQAGVSADRIQDILAEAEQRAGRIDVGDIAEPPISDAERAALPAWVQPLVDEVHNLVTGLALAEGRFYPEQVFTSVRTFLQNRAGDAVVDNDLVARVAHVARVRRENLTQNQEDLIPLLVTLRSEAGISRDDRYRIAKLIWSLRLDRLPPDTTPGQMLSLAHAVGRVIGATTSAPEAEPFTPLDQEGERLALARVVNAVGNAIQLGKNQAEQHVIAGRALDTYLENARRTADPDLRRKLITRGMAMAARQQRQEDPPPTVPQPTADPTPRPAPEPRSDRPRDPQDALYFGPLTADRGHALRALVFAVPTLVQANGHEPGTAGWASATITALEQAPRLVDGALDDHVGHPMGGRDLLQGLLPKLMLYMQDAVALGEKAPVRVATDDTVAQGPAAPVMKGAAVGVAFGPWLHDDADKGRQAGGRALELIDERRPLDAALAARLDPLVAEQPYAALLGSYEVLRPGRFGYPALRFQELTDRQQRLLAGLTDLRAAIADQLGAAKAGEFAEHARLFLPLAVAVHDRPQLDPAQVVDLARGELFRFALMYLAEAQAMARTMDSLFPRYVASMGGQTGAEQVLPRIAHHVTALVAERVTSMSAPARIDAIADGAAGVVGELLPEIERRVVLETVLARVRDRLRLTIGNEADLDALLAAARPIADELVQAPYSPRAIDGWTARVAEAALAGLGRSGTRSSAATVGVPRGRGLDGESLWPQVGMLPTVRTGGQVGTTVSSVARRQITVPAGSFANAHILSGADAEIGGRGNLPVLIQVELTFQGPVGSRVPLGRAHLLGSANALAGPERLAVDLQTLSYVLPSGRTITAEINGYVADNLHGQFGALGEWRWNAGKVLPLAVASGGMQGAGDALASITNTQVVADGISVDTTAPEDALEQALFGGVSEGFGIMSDYIKGVLDDVRPSVAVANGQRVTVVLVDPVELDVSAEEFDSLQYPTGGFAP